MKHFGTVLSRIFRTEQDLSFLCKNLIAGFNLPEYDLILSSVLFQCFQCLYRG